MPKGRSKGSTYRKHSAYDTDCIIERFRSKIKIDSKTSCWIWQGRKSKDGYGGFYCCYNGKGKIYPAHRIGYILLVKNVKDSLNVLHKCNNKTCVNPDHLYIGTHQDNMRDLRNAGTLAGSNNPNFGVPCTKEKRNKLKESNTKAWKNPIIRKKYLESFKRRKNDTNS